MSRRMFPECKDIQDPPGWFSNRSAIADFDPVLHAAGAKASGRIGNTAWALFERGDGLVLSFQGLGQGAPTLIPVDADAEKQGFMIFAGDMMAAVGRMKP